MHFFVSLRIVREGETGQLACIHKGQAQALKAVPENVKLPTLLPSTSVQVWGASVNYRRTRRPEIHH